MTLEQAGLLYAAIMLTMLGVGAVLALFDKWTAAAVILGICLVAAGISFLVVTVLIYIEIYHSFF